MSIKDENLLEMLCNLIGELEGSGEIVVCASSNSFVAKKIHNEVLKIMPNTSLKTSELSGVRSLLLEAITDKNFFDWEKPILTGFTAEGFQDIANKLPRGEKINN